MITGGCLCRAVRYRVTADVLVARACWCRLCQYLGAGSGTVNVGFPSAAVVIEGELTDYACVADSGQVMHRGFCPRCGTPVTSRAESRPQFLFLRAGTLDDPELARPQLTIWTAAAPRWAAIDPTVPCLAGQPAPPTLPAAS